MTHINRHTFYLDELIHNLEAIGEDRHEIQTIIREPIWYEPHEIRDRSLCDLILVYEKHAVPVELKGNKHKRTKALSQLEQGRLYIAEFICRPCDYGKFVIYHRDGYQHYKIGLGGTKYEQGVLDYGKDFSK